MAIQVEHSEKRNQYLNVNSKIELQSVEVAESFGWKPCWKPYLKLCVTIAREIFSLLGAARPFKLILGLGTFDSLLERNAKPLIPGIMKTPDEETQQRCPRRELPANDGTGTRESDTAAVQKNALQNLWGQSFEADSRLQLPCVFYVLYRALHLGRPWRRRRLCGGCDGRCLALAPDSDGRELHGSGVRVKGSRRTEEKRCRRKW